MASNNRAAFIAARMDEGRTRSQATADFKWAAARYDKPSAWHAKRLDGFKYTETRVQRDKVKIEDARREARELRKAGEKPTERLARKPDKIFEILKVGKRIKDLPEAPKPKGPIVEKNEIEQALALDGETIVFDSIEEYESYMIDDEDIDEDDFLDWEEWASSGGGSTGSKKG